MNRATATAADNRDFMATPSLIGDKLNEGARRAGLKEAGAVKMRQCSDPSRKL
jgi:hypothetical protein